MNLGDMIRQVIRDNDDGPDYEDVKDWINRAIDDISPIAKVQDHKYAVKVDTHTYEIPEDCRKVKEIYVDDEELSQVYERSLVGYRIWGKEISVQNAKDYSQVDIYYERPLSHLEDDEDVPEIEAEFHDLFILYASGMYQYSDEEQGLESDVLSRYYRRKDEYKAFKRVSEVSRGIRDVM